jgi:hypothetical protein
MKELHEHVWLKDCDWDAIYQQKIVAPYLPNNSRCCTDITIKSAPETRPLSDEEQELFKHYEYRNLVCKCKEYQLPSDDSILGRGHAISSISSYHHPVLMHDKTEEEEQKMDHPPSEGAAAAAGEHKGHPHQGTMVMGNQSLSLSLEQSLPTGRYVNQLASSSLKASSSKRRSHRPHDLSIDINKPSPAIITLKEDIYQLRDGGRVDAVVYGVEEQDELGCRKCDLMSSASILSSSHEITVEMAKIKDKDQPPPPLDIMHRIFSRDAWLDRPWR